MTIACPTTKAAASEHSQTTAAAISSGVPIRPTGSHAITLFRPSGMPPLKRSRDPTDAQARRWGDREHLLGRRRQRHCRSGCLLRREIRHRLHAQEHAAEIDIDNPVPFLLREIGRRRDRRRLKKESCSLGLCISGIIKNFSWNQSNRGAQFSWPANVAALCTPPFPAERPPAASQPRSRLAKEV
jgi:hypothetical protein